MKKDESRMGLREAIAMAQSVEQLTDLLVIGTQFQHVSPRTLRAWNATAKRRLVRLNAHPGGKAPSE